MQVTVCDICEERPAKKYTVSVDDQSGTTDRCAKHGEELELIVSGRGLPSRVRQAEPKPSPAKAAKAAPAKRSGRRPRVVDISEVEAARR